MLMKFNTKIKIDIHASKTIKSLLARNVEWLKIVFVIFQENLGYNLCDE